MLWLITNKKLFWSNTSGWVDRNSADVFTDTERLTLNLPVDGSWEPQAHHLDQPAG